MTERLHFHFSLSCIGEGNGNPLQCSCLENPRDEGAWWLPSMGSHRVRMTEVTQQQQYFTQHNVLRVYACCSICQNFFPFQGRILFCYMHILHFVYPFIPRWTLELLPPFTYCECCCHEPWHTESVQVPVSSSLGHIPRSRTTRLYGNSVFNFLSACVQARSISHVQLFVTSQTVARQTPLSIGFSRQEYWSGVPLPSPTVRKGQIYMIPFI